MFSRRQILPALVLLVACGASESGALPFRARVVRVADGDSLSVLDGKGARLEIRLSGIDAPERGQPFADHSRDSLRGIADGRLVTIAVDDVDRYGRLVGRVRVESLDAGLAQLEKGLAWVYPAAERLPEPERARYATAQRQAKQRKAGLWADAEPVPPWVFRRNAAGSTAPAPQASGSRVVDGPVVGNLRSKVYHRSDCPGYAAVSQKNRVVFDSVAEAEKAGCRIAGNCPR